jgi:DNA-binding HxlR family transcriptional regulator
MAAAFAAIGGKWKLTLLYRLAHGECHLAGLRRRGAPITPRVLAEQPRELEAEGLVERVETGPVPAPVAYRLTPYGKTVLPVVENVRVWGEAHLEHPRRDRYRRAHGLLRRRDRVGPASHRPSALQTRDLPRQPTVGERLP